MDELQLTVQALAATIEENMKELRAMESDGKRETRMYAHKLGEISAYNDVLNMLMWRINKKEGVSK